MPETNPVVLQDYHFALPAMIKEQRPDARVDFWHSWPNAEARICPCKSCWMDAGRGPDWISLQAHCVIFETVDRAERGSSENVSR